MKFEESFCISKGKTFTIEQITYIHNTDLIVFSNEYKEFFVCPECRKASLSYNNASIPYFKSYPKAIHEEKCSLRQDEMNKKQVNDFIENKQNHDSIVGQMESILTLLISEKPKNIIVKKLKVSTQQTPNDCNVRMDLISASKRFPRKRIDIVFRPEDFECYKFFYGNVILQWERDEKFSRYKLLLYHPETQKMLCKIFVSNVVYGYISDEYKTSKKYPCDIVFLAQFMLNSGRTYQSTSLRFGHYF